MGLIGFLLRLGKSPGKKMAIWILEHTGKHIAIMIKNSDEYWEACKRFPTHKAEIDDMAGAAFITHFLFCLVHEMGEKWQEFYMNFGFYISSNLRNLIQDCFQSISSLDDNEDEMDSSRFFHSYIPLCCAEWLYNKMKKRGIISGANAIGGDLERIVGQHEFTNVFMDECLAVRAEVALFKTKFLRYLKHDGLYDDLPMPRVAAVTGWIVFCVMCFGLVIIGRSVGYLMMVGGFKFKVSILDVVVSIVGGTYFFFKTKDKKNI